MRTIIWSNESLEYDQFDGQFKQTGEQDDDDMEEFVEFGNISLLKKPKKLISTPIGLFQLDDHMNPYKQYQMWQGDANFDLTGDILEAMQDIPGVEGLQPLSRYKFIIAIGKAFDMRSVRVMIDEYICGKKPVYEDINAKIKRMAEELKSFEDWALYCFPNGVIDYVYIDDKKPNKDEFVSKLHEFEQAKKLSRGVVLRKEEYERARTPAIGA